MRLLLDENLSWRLVQRLADAFPGSAHVDQVGLHGEEDGDVWRLAQDEGYTIVSKDADFYQRSVAYGPPPKVIWVRIGNGPAEAAEQVLRENADLIGRFAADPAAGFLVLSATRL